MAELRTRAGLVLAALLAAAAAFVAGCEQTATESDGGEQGEDAPGGY